MGRAVRAASLGAGFLALSGGAVAVAGSLLEGTARIGFGPAGSAVVPLRVAGIMCGVIAVIAAIGWFIGRGRGRNWYLGCGAAIVAFLITAAARGTSLDLTGLMAQSVRMATPIALGALAGILCERSGVINIAIEGMMLTGACAGFITATFARSSGIGVIAAVVAGGLMAALHALLTITHRTDQIVSGTAINILAVGITGFARRSLLLREGLPMVKILPTIHLPLLSQIPIVGPVLFSHQPIVFVSVALLVIIHIGLYYTPWGVRTRACGEHPRAADTVGIRVNRLRIINVIAGGLVAGLAGAWFSLETTGTFDDVMTSGKGFIALAAMIFGKWRPFGAFLGALLFGFADALQIKLQVLGIGIPYQILGMLPYLVTIIALTGLVGRAVPPAADGQPYISGE